MIVADLATALDAVLTADHVPADQASVIEAALWLLRDGAELLRPGDLFGPAQAAEFLGVNRTTVSRWKREGTMPTPFQDLGDAGTWTLWTRASLETFKAQREDDKYQPAASAADA